MDSMTTNVKKITKSKRGFESRAQEGRCLICGDRLPGIPRVPQVDHGHKGIKVKEIAKSKFDFEKVSRLAQEGRCMVCGDKLPGNPRGLRVDYHPKTKRICGP